MTEWREVLLGDVVDVFDHKRVPLSSAQRSVRKGPYPYYGAQGIIDFIDDFIFDGRFILVPEDGENLRSRKLPIAFFAEGQFWVNNHAHIIKARPGVASDRFIQSAILAADIAPFVTGAAQPKLSQANLRRIPLVLPSLRTQELVAGLLDALDELIENNRRRVEVLEEMARAIYREWFVHFRYPGHEHATLVDSPLGLIPEGWCVRPLGDVATIDRTSVRPDRSPGEVFDHYSIPSFDDGQRPVVESGLTIKSGKFLLNKPAVMVSKLNPRIERVWFVEPAEGSRSVASTEFLVLRPATHLSLEFLYLMARSEPFQLRLKELSGGTSTSHQRAKPADFLGLAVIEPTAGPADRLVAATGEQLRLARTLRIHNQYLAATRDLLLPKLVTGQIDVSSLDLDALGEGAVA
ncbi:MAG: restriction endonuclease subunit S [Egibacteraceae bacterium]